MKISIVFPAYNEENRIANSLNKACDYCAEAFDAFEIIVVDDGSTDRTSEVAANISSTQIKVFKNEENYGKGYSVRRGILEATFPYVLYTDCDLPVPLAMLNKFFTSIQDGADIVIGSKYSADSLALTRQSPIRFLMGKTYRTIVSLLVLPGFHDTQAGFKLLKTDVAKEIFASVNSRGFAFEVEMLLIARKLNYRIDEIGIPWRHHEGSRIRLSIDPAKMFLDVVIIALKNLFGRYNNHKLAKISNNQSPQALK